jgi:hypothetical protein
VSQARSVLQNQLSAILKKEAVLCFEENLLQTLRLVRDTACNTPRTVGKYGQHTRDSSIGASKLAYSQLRGSHTTDLDAGFCVILADCFDDTGMGSLLLAGATSGRTFRIR